MTLLRLSRCLTKRSASKAVGDGVAVKPTDKTVVSPAAGTIVKIFNTNHAFCLETEKGAEIVVHMGIDTVALNGQGFTRLVEEGAEVAAGQPILEMDLDFLNANALHDKPGRMQQHRRLQRSGDPGAGSGGCRPDATV